MNIGIIGSGAIGLLFASYLRKATECVTLYTRTYQQANRLCKQGVTCIANGRKETVFVRAEPFDMVPSLQDDYLFIAVKQYHLPSLIPYLTRSGSRCIFLQNGMSHISLFQHVNDRPVAVGIVEHGAKKEGDGIVEHTGMGQTKLGIVHGTKEQFAPLFSLFSPSVFPLAIEENWIEVLTDKLIVNACINPLTALYGVSNGTLLTNPHLHAAMKSVFEEVVSIVGSEKHAEHWRRVCDVCKKTADNRSSMLTDISFGRQTEIDAIVGYLLNEARLKQKQAPILSFLYESIKGLESPDDPL